VWCQRCAVGRNSSQHASSLAGHVTHVTFVRPPPPPLFAIRAAQTVITTHFADVFDHGLLSDEGHAVSFYHMQVLLKDKHGDEPAGPGIDEVVPVFNLVPGKCASSFGLSCAKQAGVPADVLARARQVRTEGGVRGVVAAHAPTSSCRVNECGECAQAQVCVHVCPCVVFVCSPCVFASEGARALVPGCQQGLTASGAG
jgi:hypothetical protein